MYSIQLSILKHLYHFICLSFQLYHADERLVVFPLRLSGLVLISSMRLDGRNGSSPPEVFLRKGVLKICSKFTGEHPYRSVI